MAVTTLPAVDGPPSVGSLLRGWRRRRRLSQLDLANAAAVSARHLSFVETGRSKPSPELVMHLAEHLDVPLRERNTLLLAAGFAPRYAQTPLDDAAMAPVREALDTILAGHHPFPAVVADRHWNLVTANEAAFGLLTRGVAPELLASPANVLRVSLHPDGMAPRILNFEEWARDLLGTLDRQVAATRDRRLRDLLEEVTSYPNVAALGGSWRTRGETPTIVVPLRLRVGEGASAYTQSWFSTNTSIGTPVDITLEELHVELFHPADEATAALVGGRTA